MSSEQSGSNATRQTYINPGIEPISYNLELTSWARRPLALPKVLSQSSCGFIDDGRTPEKQVNRNKHHHNHKEEKEKEKEKEIPETA
jgi:hypothetical protein